MAVENRVVITRIWDRVRNFGTRFGYPIRLQITSQGHVGIGTPAYELWNVEKAAQEVTI